MVESVVSSGSVFLYTVAVFCLGYLCGLVRGKYGNPQNALSALNAWAKRAMKTLRAKIFGR